jgi:hypothetical protein
MADPMSLAVAELLDIESKDVNNDAIYKCIASKGGLKALADAVERIAFNRTYGPR